MKKLMMKMVPGAWCLVPGAAAHGVRRMVLGAGCLALAMMLAGCTATKIKYERNATGETRYSIWHNGHWLKTEAEVLSGGMSESGKFEFGAQGLRSSPSEEFNRTMQTYTSAIVSMMQIAAAAYNPSASAAMAASSGRGATALPETHGGASATAATAQQALNSNTHNSQLTNSNTQPLNSQPAADPCPGGVCDPAPQPSALNASTLNPQP